VAKGRPSKSGKRHTCGKLVAVKGPKFVSPADYIERARERFRKFQGGKADAHIRDPIGRAWAVGLLENHRFDPAVLRDAGRDYADRHFSYFPGGSSIANYEGQDRRGDHGVVDPVVKLGVEVPRDLRGERYRKLDAAMRDAGMTAYHAAQSVLIDCHWVPDTNPPWLERLINDRLAKAGVPVFGPLSIGGDMEFARQAIAGLISLAEGTQNTARALAA
jgi:hypothetical protein